MGGAKNYLVFAVLFLFIFIFSSDESVFAEELPPDHDIVLFELTQKQNRYTISNPVVIASTPGYDNQPFFSADGKTVYFTHIDKEQADIWQWSLETKQSSPLVSDALSEFSPTVIPSEKDSLSTVRVESDGTQRLWKYNPKKGFSVVFEDIKPVGYHAWSGQNIGFFILGEPHEFHVSQLGRKQSKVVDKDIGRCLQKRPNENAVSYTVNMKKQSVLKVYNFDTETTAEIATLPSQDYVWYAHDQIISSNGQNVLLVSSQGQTKWIPIENSAKFKLSGISRLALSPDKSKLAVVHQKKN